MKAPVGTAIKKASSLLDTGVGMAHAGQKDDSSERLSIAAVDCGRARSPAQACRDRRECPIISIRFEGSPRMPHHIDKV